MNCKKKVAAIMGILTVILSLFGCARSSGISEYEDKIKFSTFTQDERKAYIQDYLKATYSEDYTVSDVTQKQTTAVKNEQLYFATATNSNNEMISIWVSPSGDVKDTHFMIEYQSNVTDYYNHLVTKFYPSSIVYANCEIRTAPSKTWSLSDNIEDLLETEDCYTIIRIFAEKPDEGNHIDELLEELSKCNGHIYLYQIDDLSSFVYDNADLTAYTISREFERS